MPAMETAVGKAALLFPATRVANTVGLMADGSSQAGVNEGADETNKPTGATTVTSLGRETPNRVRKVRVGVT